MKKYLKPIIAFSIVFVGVVFIKLGNSDSLVGNVVGALGIIVTGLPAYLWYNDKLNM